jgi:signal transduction histidine kinase
MNTVVSQFTAAEQDVSLVPGEISLLSQSGASPAFLEDLIHELRQPLGVIETLAYFIEITTTDEAIATRLQHMQAMLTKVHHILESATEDRLCSCLR